jgi:hypothetical protein
VTRGPASRHDDTQYTRRIAVATMTWVRSAKEEALLRRSLQRLAGIGLPVAVADSGSNAAFTDFLQRLPGFVVTVPSTRGLVAQVSASLGAAASFDAPFTLYTEPDKWDFFGAPLHAFLRRALDKEDAGIVIAARSDEAMATFPPMQRYTEGVINHLSGEICGAAGDYSYGPFLIARALLPAIIAFEPALGWGWRHAAFVRATRRGFRVAHVVDRHECPPDQRTEDDAERAHRLRQLSQNVLGLVE